MDSSQTPVFFTLTWIELLFAQTVSHTCELRHDHSCDDLRLWSGCCNTLGSSVYCIHVKLQTAIYCYFFLLWISSASFGIYVVSSTNTSVPLPTLLSPKHDLLLRLWNRHFKHSCVHTRKFWMDTREFIQGIRIQSIAAPWTYGCIQCSLHARANELAMTTKSISSLMVYQ